MKQTVRSIIAIVIFIGTITTARAQQAPTVPVLPNFQALIKPGKIQLDWISGFPNTAQIGIQRSLDSVLNFTTIGYASYPTESRNAYLDNKPLPGKSYYRLFILFKDNRFMYSKTVLAVPDSTISGTTILGAGDITNATPGATGTQSAVPWKPSPYIYTTADGNVNIRLPQAPQKKYSIKFFEPTGTFLFEVEQVTEPFLILEKATFMHAGWFNFEIYEDGKLFEKWSVFIPLNYRN
ncbi:hypothetical protein [Chitinophaga lutea]|uniref:hypothetical protein n=1 Tax=Chitinophaga lutea TaxID=2488634 RepID=UPI000F4F4D5D|nr:hypothetical protein [Chitinophaga lutea]